MARQNTPGGRAGDFTGRQKAELQEQHAAEQQAAAESLALATAQAKATEHATIDLEPKKEEVPEKVVGDVAVSDVDVAEEIKVFRVNETLENVTIGHGNHYDFVEGQEYRAPKRIYDHLEEKGLIWH
jgi:hypothetical protein